MYPIAAVREALASCGRASLRQRALPAEAMVYYVVALGLSGRCQRGRCCAA